MKRLISCDTSDLEGRTRQELLGALEASEGRVIVQELSLFRDAAMLEPITDAEIACAFGADLILLNAFDCVNPHVAGITAPATSALTSFSSPVTPARASTTPPLSRSRAPCARPWATTC